MIIGLKHEIFPVNDTRAEAPNVENPAEQLWGAAGYCLTRGPDCGILTKKFMK